MFMRKVFTGLALLVFIAALALAWVWNDLRRYQPVYGLHDVPLADFAAAPSGEVWFPGFNARGAADIVNGGATAVKEPVVGTLLLPAEASAQQRVPAVVILHGSGGDFTGRAVHLAQKLAAVGIAGFAVDTFRSRGLTAADDYFARLQRATIYTQIADGFNALKALQRHPYIRGDRVAVAGFSLGGSSALYSAFEPVAAPLMGDRGPRFAAHLMFYTGCALEFEDFRLDRAPWLVMLGSRDESTPPARCRALIDRARAAGVRSAELKVYEGAGHGWNSPEPLQFHPDAFVMRDCTPVWRRDGQVIEKGSGLSFDNPLVPLLVFRTCGAYGYSMGRHDAANRQSVRDTLDFLDRQWDGDWSTRLTDAILAIGIPAGPGEPAAP